MENARSALEKRLGSELFALRVLKQSDKETGLLHQGEGLLRIERILPLDLLVSTFLRLTGLAPLARRGFLGVRTVEQTWHLARLPVAFDGFRLLQLTDLHIDLDDALVPVIENLVHSIPHDAAVFTGDFRNKTTGDFTGCIRNTARIVSACSPRRWGILGNHDSIEMVPALEEIGLPILLNESASVLRGTERLWFAGTDDPHFYRTHNLRAARAQIPPNACTILLAHSPEIHEEAAGLDLVLCGHTHGGQLCLPGGRHIVVPCELPQKFLKGRWHHGDVQGYTSPGTGSCGIAARLNCPPEITVHTLRSGFCESKKS